MLLAIKLRHGYYKTTDLQVVELHKLVRIKRKIKFGWISAISIAYRQIGKLNLLI